MTARTLALAALLAAGSLFAGDPPPQLAKPLSPEDALLKARANGKYRMLLRQFKAPADVDLHKAFADVGPRDQRSHAGQDDLPKGYWVYVYPYWYIWRDTSTTVRSKPSWCVDQVLGEPDETQGSDSGKNWCSLTADNQDEWLLLEYAELISPKAVIVHENVAPGAVYRVTAFKLDGTEVEVWKGQDPTPVGDPGGISIIPVKADFKANRFKVYLKSTEVPYWNEIDAVGIRDADGKTHWAAAAEASTAYASTTPAPQPAPFVPPAMIDSGVNERLMRLEAELKDVKKSQAEITSLLKELTGLVKESNKRREVPK